MMVPVEISKAIVIPKTIDTDDDDDKIAFLCCIEDDDEEDKIWDEQRISTENKFGGGLMENIGGGGGNWEQLGHLLIVFIYIKSFVLVLLKYRNE